MIELRHLSKRYGTHLAVDDLSFSIDRGVVYGFLGPNGAGKSTTMNIMTGCLGATEGEVLIDGHNVAEEPMEAKKHIGYLPELPPLYGDMTPEEYLRFVARAKGLRRRKGRQVIETVMEKTPHRRCGENGRRSGTRRLPPAVALRRPCLAKPGGHIILTNLRWGWTRRRSLRSAS